MNWLKKPAIILLLGFLLFASIGKGQTVFINEIHYDNNGADTGEGFNIAGPTGTDLSCYSIILYNGGTGASYATINLTGIIDNEGCGYGELAFLHSSIQNGAPDGLALYNTCTSILVQFLSYEGFFTATNGVANGVTSTDIGVLESNATAVGSSLQLSGTGTIYTNFSWNTAAANTNGTTNTGQNFCSCTIPTVQASFTSFIGVTSSSLTVNFGTGTGGNGRIVVISNAIITATPTSGSTYTANSVYGSGTDIGINEFVVYDGAGTSVTVTGLNYNTTYYAQIFEYATGGSTSPCYNESTSSNIGNTTTLCGTTTEPTIAASSILFPTIDCNYLTINWTPGNGGNAIVVMSTVAITGIPTDQTPYVANSAFGSGSILNAGEYVVYNGIDSSVTVTGLVAGMTYFVEVFEYNVTTTNCDENYLTSITVSSTQATASVCCPQINSILVNACGLNTEGTDEQVIFRTGANSLNVNDISITYPSAGSYCNTTCGANTNINNATYVNSLNTLSGCSPNLFYYADPIPANSTVIMFTGTPPSVTLDYSSICGSGPYYVVFNNNTSTTGRFANNAGADRTTTMNFGGGCIQTVTYYSSSANTGTVGDYVYFDSLGVPSYKNNGLCVVAPLPIELLNFEGYGDNAVNFLNWATASEINNDYFDVERSVDGFTFESLGMVYGNGTATYQNDYSFIDEYPFPSLNYYRLKQVDFNGNYEFSNTIVVKSKVSGFSIWQANDFLHISTSKEVKNIKNITIYSTLGQLIYTTNNGSTSLITTSSWRKGIYLVQIQTGNSSFTKKIQFK